MAGFGDDLNTLYKKFILRDFLSFVVPGGIVFLSIAFISTFIYDFPEVKLKDVPFVVYFALYGVLYILGFVCQAVGYVIWKWWYGIPCFDDRNRFIHDRVTDDEHLRVLRDFYQVNGNTTLITEQHERFVVLKQMTGNNAVAFGIGAILGYLIRIIMRKSIPFDPAVFLIFVLMLLVCSLLIYAHSLQKKEQMRWETLNRNDQTITEGL